MVCVNGTKTGGKHVCKLLASNRNVFTDCFYAVHTHQLDFANTSLPTLVCRMKAALVTNKRDQQFFFNTEYLQKYNATKSEKKKVQVPGHHYFKKIDSIISTSMISGEIFHEYCVDQTVPPTPRPDSDISKLPKFHYLQLVDTPCTKENGERREVDGFQPRARF